MRCVDSPGTFLGGGGGGGEVLAGLAEVMQP